MRVTLTLAAAALLLSGCSDSSEHPLQPQPTPSPTVPAALAMPTTGPVTDPRQALALVPASAEAVTITNWDALRAQLGANNLTSNSLMADRDAFWERADEEGVLLADGLLRDQNSLYMLDYGFTQDDVDFEVHWAGPDGEGYLLGFRPDQAMSEVTAAVKDHAGALDGAEVLPEEHVVGDGFAAVGTPVWASLPELTDLTDPAAPTAYLSRTCTPLRQALGPDATYEDQDAVVERSDPTYLRPLGAWAITFTDSIATARLGLGRTDLYERADLMEWWPVTGSIGVADAFTGSTVADPQSGRIGMQVANPVAAATLTLTGQLPFAVCNEVLPFEEPTGL